MSYICKVKGQSLVAKFTNFKFPIRMRFFEIWFPLAKGLATLMTNRKADFCGVRRTAQLTATREALYLQSQPHSNASSSIGSNYLPVNHYPGCQVITDLRLLPKHLKAYLPLHRQCRIR